MATAAPTTAQRSSRIATALIAALVLLLAWQLAYWTWVFFAPAAVHSAPASETGTDLALAARLFGGTVASGGATSASGGTLRLKGVVAPTPATIASAIFGTGTGRDVVVLLDQEVQPGVKLVEVHPDHVFVSRAGVRSRIELERRMASAPSAAAGARGAPPSFKLNVARSGGNNFTLSRRELDDALKDPNQLNHLGRIGPGPQGGVRMEAAPPGSLAQKLGLQPGDVIRKVNGQTVASAGDLARLYTQFGTLSMVQADVQRGSATVQLSYAIQP